MQETSLLSIDNIALCMQKIGYQNQLVFGAMLSYFKTQIKFSESSVPSKLILQIAAELDIAVSDISGFDWNGRTAKRFRQQIRNHLGYREAIDKDAIEFMATSCRARFAKRANGSFISRTDTKLFSGS